MNPATQELDIVCRLLAFEGAAGLKPWTLASKGRAGLKEARAIQDREKVFPTRAWLQADDRNFYSSCVDYVEKAGFEGGIVEGKSAEDFVMHHLYQDTPIFYKAGACRGKPYQIRKIVLARLKRWAWTMLQRHQRHKELDREFEKATTHLPYTPNGIDKVLYGDAEITFPEGTDWLPRAKPHTAALKRYKPLLAEALEKGFANTWRKHGLDPASLRRALKRTLKLFATTPNYQKILDAVELEKDLLEVG